MRRFTGLQNRIGAERTEQILINAESVVRAGILRRGEARITDDDVVICVHANARITVEQIGARIIELPVLKDHPGVGGNFPPLHGAARGRVGRKENRVGRPKRAVAKDHIVKARVTHVNQVCRAELRREIQVIWGGLVPGDSIDIIDDKITGRKDLAA